MRRGYKDGLVKEGSFASLLAYSMLDDNTDGKALQRFFTKAGNC